MSVQRVAVAEKTRAANTLANPDYASAFHAPFPAAGLDHRSPEQWARAVFEEAPPPVRWFLLFGWRIILGLRLGPLHSPDHILGWQIASTATDSLTLELDSRLISAHNILEIDPTGLRWTTFVHYRSRPARLVWATVLPFHNVAIPFTLKRAVAHPPLR